MYRIGKEEIDAVARVINSKQLFRINNEGKECETFEKELAEKMGANHALLLASGTGALICALAGLGVGPGDEVIVPGYTFMATASAVLAVGAIPVLAEIDETMTIDPIDVEKKITDKTKCIIPVHICGFPSNLDALKAIAEKHNLVILEDACQADGGSYKGQRLGTIGIVVKVTEEARDYISRKGYDPQYGARPLKRAVQTYLEDELSEILIEETLSPDEHILVSLDGDTGKLKYEKMKIEE